MVAERFKMITDISKRLLNKACTGKGPFFSLLGVKLHLQILSRNSLGVSFPLQFLVPSISGQTGNIEKEAPDSLTAQSFSGY